MADLSTKKDPLNLPHEKPDYVEDTSGPERSERDPDAQPAVGTDPMEPSSSEAEKPTVHLDEEAVRKAEREGKGF
jgi:hypothetical protein